MIGEFTSGTPLLPDPAVDCAEILAGDGTCYAAAEVVGQQVTSAIVDVETVGDIVTV